MTRLLWLLLSHRDRPDRKSPKLAAWCLANPASAGGGKSAGRGTDDAELDIQMPL
jgi:hypothetical protein